VNTKPERGPGAHPCKLDAVQTSIKALPNLSRPPPSLSPRFSGRVKDTQQGRRPGLPAPLREPGTGWVSPGPGGPVLVPPPGWRSPLGGGWTRPRGRASRWRAGGSHTGGARRRRGKRAGAPRGISAGAPRGISAGACLRMNGGGGGEARGRQLPKDHLAPRYNRAIKGSSAFQKLGTSCSLTPRGF
jgi:hypothetical protein